MSEPDTQPTQEQIRAFREQDTCSKRICVNAIVAAEAHMGEAWQEYRRLWLRWFEERVEKRYARQLVREVKRERAAALEALEEAQGKQKRLRDLALEATCPDCIQKTDEACVDEGCNWGRQALAILGESE